MPVPRASAHGETRRRAVNGIEACVSGGNRQAKSPSAKRPVRLMVSERAGAPFTDRDISWQQSRTSIATGAESVCTVHFGGKRSEGKAA